MAKITRSTLKGIVKECLVELLQEGLDGNTALNETKSRKLSRHKKEEVLRAEKDRLEQHRRKLDTTVSNATDDPLMQELLAHTANTTLQEQINNDRPGSQPISPQGTPGDPGINLDTIFGDSNSNWSSLAFPEKKTD